MFRKINTFCLLFSIIFVFSNVAVFGQDTSDWNKVILQVNNEIAVKTTNNKTVYGKLNSANANEIVINLALKKSLSNQTVTIQKSDVKKVWTTKLNLRKGLSSSTTTAIGAGVGAGIGIGIGFGALASSGGSDESYAILALSTAVGAGAGALIGYFASKSGHKKLNLIYKG
jgi:hypothetical protein